MQRLRNVQCKEQLTLKLWVAGCSDSQCFARSNVPLAEQGGWVPSVQL